jgi:fatty acid-binding protein DegV
MLAEESAGVSGIAVEQGAAPNEADKLRTKLAAIFPGKDIYSSVFGSAVAVHTGPRVVGVCVLGG